MDGDHICMYSIDFFIGDVHGRSDLLAKLLAFLQRHARMRDAHPRYTFLGDLVDRGPDSRGCMEMAFRMIERNPGSVLLLGNHEQMLLDAIQTDGKSDLSGSWGMNGGMATINSYMGNNDYKAMFRAFETRYAHHREMIENASLFVEREGLLAVHAGVDPSTDFEKQDVHTLSWIREPFLDNVDVTARPVIHGHTIVGKLPVVTENRISMDTGVCEHGRLSACIVDPETWEISFAQASRQGTRYVEPTRLDRGFGTLLDEPRRIFDRSYVAASRVNASEAKASASSSSKLNSRVPEASQPHL